MYVSVRRSRGRCLPKVCQRWQRRKHTSPLWWLRRASGTACWLVRAQTSIHSLWLTPPSSFWWEVSHQLWWLLFSARHVTQSSHCWCWEDRPPEHSSFRCYITKTCIFMGRTEEGSTWDFPTSPSPDVLTTSACQQAGSLPRWEIMSTVITEVWRS